MGIARRRFVKFIGSAVAGLAVPAGWLAKRVVPTRHVQVARKRLYPGPLKRLNHTDIKRPGRWAG